MRYGWAKAFVTAMLVACGSEEPTGDDAGKDATTGLDAADGSPFGDVGLTDTFVDDAPPPQGPCPTSAPAVDASCSYVGVGLECEYGSSWYPGCDAVFVCTSDRTWAAEQILGCPADAGSCPAVDAGSTCSSKVGPCDYADRHCECAQQCGGPCCGGTAWTCYVPAKEGCPYPRPDIGAACTTEGQTCAYGDCCSGTHLVCSDGLWRQWTCIPPP